MPDDFQQALPTGHRIEEYEIVRVLGAGGFGITYLAFDHNLNGPVAIKEYFYAGLATRTSGGAVEPNSTSNDDGFQWGRDRFLDEAQVLSRLDHPNIVRVHRYFEENNTAYIVMDYVEGESLAVFLKAHGTLTPDQWRPWMEALLGGMEHVHGRKYLHRDIKPENIVIRARADGESQPVLIDFGSARRAAADKTRQLTAVHTPGYAPIEQYSTASPQGPATDIYALSAVSYRVLAGEPPPNAADRVVKDDYRPLSERIADADRAWLAGIDHGLGLRPDDRPKTVAAWRAVLVSADNASSPTTPLDPTRAVSSAASTPPARARITADGKLLRGFAYLEGDGVAKDDKEAARWFRLAADQGSASAQFFVGLLYATGRGVLQDDEKAVQWLRLAADQGHADAQCNLGVAYAEGRGVIPDDAEAVRWIHLAAEQGNAAAQCALGSMYETGRGVTADDAEAVRWFRLAAEQGDLFARWFLDWRSKNPLKRLRAWRVTTAFFLKGMRSRKAAQHQSSQLRNYVAAARDRVAARMTPADLREAQRLAREWRPRD